MELMGPFSNPELGEQIAHIGTSGAAREEGAPRPIGSDRLLRAAA
jgi:hypothetical protein